LRVEDAFADRYHFQLRRRGITFLEKACGLRPNLPPPGVKIRAISGQRTPRHQA
jgi:hypothetical protein